MVCSVSGSPGRLGSSQPDVASQTEGSAKEPAFLATALTERTFAARGALVEGVCDQRPPALEVATDLTKVHVGQSLLAEPERTLFARRATVAGTSAGEWSIAYWAASGGGLVASCRRCNTRNVWAAASGRMLSLFVPSARAAVDLVEAARSRCSAYAVAVAVACRSVGSIVR